ncbi:uncharacterized protein IAS62_005909 [Cryptococcus decagattii]|uniref:Uncharacterized protein n=1 Tax=Cryptococcus decagattii TaxID=1859122 RepID=A0ABZ2B508_9TREE
MNSATAVFSAENKGSLGAYLDTIHKLLGELNGCFYRLIHFGVLRRGVDMTMFGCIHDLLCLLHIGKHTRVHQNRRPGHHQGLCLFPILPSLGLALTYSLSSITQQELPFWPPKKAGISHLPTSWISKYNFAIPYKWANTASRHILWLHSVNTRQTQSAVRASCVRTQTETPYVSYGPISLQFLFSDSPVIPRLLLQHLSVRITSSGFHKTAPKHPVVILTHSFATAAGSYYRE